LSGAQSIVGLAAGVTSIVGAFYSAVYHFRPLPEVGEVVAVVRAAPANEPVQGATVEILTTQDALVTTLTPTDDGEAHRTLKPGQYRLRVSHPQFVTETRDVQVLPGETAEVRLQLTRARGPHGKRSGPVDKTIGATRRLLGRLGL